jgi:tRNA-dihydrouridine synthase
MALQLEKHLIVQFCGNDPTTIVTAAKYVHNNVSAIDLNCGCPQKIAKRGNYGAYLLKKNSKSITFLNTWL